MKKHLIYTLSLLVLSFSSQSQAQIIFQQNEDIVIDNNNTNANHYPSILTVSNLPTKIAGFAVRVSLTTGSLPTPFLDVILEGPQGQTSYLLSDVGNGQGVTNIVLTIFDTAPLSMPTIPNVNLPLSSGFFKPTDGPLFTDIFSAPAPVGPYGTNLSVFGDTNPNGDWKLYATSIAPIPPLFAYNITQWELLFFLHPQNDYNGDGLSDYVLKKGQNVYVVNDTNAISITKSTTPNFQIKAKIVGGADLDGDHISDLIVKKGQTIQGLKGPDFSTPIHSLKVKGMKPVASGDFNGDLIPDLYFQKKTSFFVAINTGTGFQPLQLVADKTLPKKFKVFGALSGRLQPTALAQNKTTVASLAVQAFSTLTTIAEI
ncbi:MAG: VCBS repeat-containing protein [Verrucomicrobiia bacterium]